MSTATRLRRLEQRLPRPGACPLCTRPSGALVRVVLRESGAVEVFPCPGCGRQPPSFTLDIGRPGEHPP
jgi:hypothetical protein